LCSWGNTLDYRPFYSTCVTKLLSVFALHLWLPKIFPTLVGKSLGMDIAIEMSIVASHHSKWVAVRVEIVDVNDL